ncbi:MAG: alpha/beta family hydrolase [Myxococcota bacterium]
MTPDPTPLDVEVSASIGRVSALFTRPADARAQLVLAHGAGAGMRHAFLEGVTARLAENGIACFRYQFPYWEAGRRAPNPPRVLTATVRAAVERAHAEAPDLPLFAGGKSLGGRMTSTAMAAEPLPAVRGLVFFGFPLHAPGKPGNERAAHLASVPCPMLFLQGTRDKLADLDLFAPVFDELGARATPHIVEGADHSFQVLKRSGRTHEEVLDELVAQVGAFADRVGSA